jgi:mannosylglucosylglycerate synthase
MKIALMHYSSPPVVGGVEGVLAQHARLMSNAGHQVTILAGRGSAFDDRVPVHILPQLNSRYPEVLKLKAVLDKGTCPPEFDRLSNQICEDLLGELMGFDLLFAHNIASLNKNLALTTALHSAYQSRGFPHLVLWCHDLAWTAPRYSMELHDGHPWDLLRSRWEDASYVAVSVLRRQQLSDLTGLPVNSIRVIPNGVDLSAFFKLEPQTIEIMKSLDLHNADPLFLLPVRLTPRKNIELALQVLSELRRAYPRATLLVTGPEGPHNPANANYTKKLLILRDELGLRGAAHFLAEGTQGFIPDAVIADLYRLADALIYPSRDEGFGIPILEAAFSYIPVFCSDLPVFRELGGSDVSYFDLEASPVSIALMIHDRLESEATSRWSRHARHAFSWDSIYSDHIDPLIQEVKK